MRGGELKLLATALKCVAALHIERVAGDALILQTAHEIAVAICQNYRNTARASTFVVRRAVGIVWVSTQPYKEIADRVGGHKR